MAYLKPTLITLLIFLGFITSAFSQSPQGCDLWLGYNKVKDLGFLNEYNNRTNSIYFEDGGEILKAAKKELSSGLQKMLGHVTQFNASGNSKNTLLIAKTATLDAALAKELSIDFFQMGSEGFAIKSIPQKQIIVITANEDIGILYGVFRLLNMMQKNQSLSDVSLLDSPKIDIRMLNHWDNLDRTVERGYAGFSLWNWHKLPEYIDQRYIDYARANASIGINAVSLTNVNANALIMTPMYLEKVRALANVFRPYGIKVYLTARFSAPIEIGGLATADPLESKVQDWWNQKANEIYTLIPDFGGFLVKANSEGQPGPQNYGRNHVDGANMMAKALYPHYGKIIWRAFVYSEHDSEDRAKQAYNEFVPLDGQFMDNVLVQTKNGPIDFQPREPFHPMFGAMPKTPLMMEF